MKWCRECNETYDDEIKVCSKCNSTLEDANEEDMLAEVAYRELVKVTQVANQVEADIVISVLNSCDIECFKRYEKSGSYLNIYAGFDFQGVDLYVAKENEIDALVIIKDIELGDNKDSENDDSEEDNLEEAMQKRAMSIRILMATMAFIGIAGILFVLYSVM